MLKVNTSARFRKDLKACVRRDLDIQLLEAVVNTLRAPAPLAVKNKDHPLSGNWAGCRECHILPDWLLIYRLSSEELYLVRTGTHADLLGE